MVIYKCFLKLTQLNFVYLLTILTQVISLTDTESFPHTILHFIFFNTIHKNIRPASESEKNRAIEILNKSLNLNGYQVNVWNVYSTNNREIVNVDLLKGNSRKHYLIDLNEDKIIELFSKLDDETNGDNPYSLSDDDTDLSDTSIS